MLGRLLAAAWILLAPASEAVETRWWTHREYADYERARLDKLSLASDGTLTLAPTLRLLLDSSSTYLWALAEDAQGNLYAAGGGPGAPGARIHLIPAKGQPRVVAEIEALEVHALAFDPQGRLYAATSPDGRVYRIAPSGGAEPYYDPRAKYIWDMAFDREGRLYVATGDRGEIHRVLPGGAGSVFYRVPDTHARSLALDARGNLLVGTEPGGLVLRVSPKGEGFVLFQASRREITALAVAADGVIYAAGVGTKQPAPSAPPAPAPAATPQPSPLPTLLSPQQQTRPQPTPSPLPPLATAAAPVTGGSEIYRIEPDGFPRRIWSHAQDIVYALVLDAEGRLLVGTGNRGVIYRLDSAHRWTSLLTLPSTQVTRLLAGRGGVVYAATGNIGQVYRFGPGREAEGSVESDPLDAGMFSYWGRLQWRGAENGGQILLATRSGNLERPQQDWSPYSEPFRGSAGAVSSPPARFLQWRAVLRAAPDGRSPELRAVEIAWRQRNVAPQITQVEIAPANYRVPPPSLSLSTSQSLTLPPLGQRGRPSTPAASSESSSLTLNYAAGFRTVRWAASDDNGDELVYRVEIRGARESEWKLLRDRVRERHLSWDTTAFADGEYLVRIVASDAPDNAAGEALTAELVSDPFLIDNTGPEILQLEAALEGNAIRLRFRARDAVSTISQAECSINGGEWIRLEPVDRIADSQLEAYDVVVPGVEGREFAIAVRVTDEHDNQAVARTVLVR
ncbi:MAG: hypothetical protein RMI94_08835 [Bryobacterales bacterium]|nr:hypothetical protein [Bryobacteraceae bacterium]MDW8130642.1 hypothetical protein [Bryobacterales bacterium]